MKLFSGLILLAAVTPTAFAQLTVSTIPRSTLAIEMFADAGFQSTITNDLYTPPNTAGGAKRESFSFNSPTLGLIEFGLMGITDPLPLPQTVVNPTSLSFTNGFIVSFVSDAKLDVNNFGADNGAGFQTIFSDYSESDPLAITTSRLVLNNGGSTNFSFLDRNVSQGGVTWSMDDESHFLVYQSRQQFNGTNFYLLALEDRAGTAFLDYNDGIFLLQHPLSNSPDLPVPEPSTYGVIGAAALLGLIARRRLGRYKSEAATRS